MRRVVVAFFLAIGWMVSPWIVAAEEPPIVERMYDAMAWCLPRDTRVDDVRIRANGTQSLFGATGEREFALMLAPTALAFEIITVKHPENPNLRFGVPLPSAHDSAESLRDQKFYTQLMAGCFVLTQAPAH